MKNKILTALLVAVMTASLLVGCGSSSSSSSSSGTSTSAKATTETSASEKKEEEKKEAEPKEEKEAEPEVKEEENLTVDDWVNDSMNQAMVSYMSNSEMDIFLIAADDKTVSFQFQFKEYMDLSGVDQSEIDDLFDSQIDAQEDVFTDMRDQLVKDTKIDDVVLRIEYLNEDGSMIYSRDFTK